jgi:hypothetical protein
MSKRRVAIVGTGFGAYGALKGVLGASDLEIVIFDIGLTSRLPEQPDKPVHNAKPFKGSFFTYGVNDNRWCVKLESERLCSSHALGGHSTVYSGAVLYPKESDIKAWPASSRPKPVDYREILESLHVLHEIDSLEQVFPLYPTTEAVADAPPEGTSSAILGLSRLAVTEETDSVIAASKGSINNESVKRLKPFQLPAVLHELFASKNVVYHDNCYVTKTIRGEAGTYLEYETNGQNRADLFDAVFLGAGCVNTTGIVDRSLHGEGSRKYEIKMPGGGIQAFFRFALRAPKVSALRRVNGLPEFFLEINSPLTHGTWSHTQITMLNEQIVTAVCSKLPPLLHPLVRSVSGMFYFALSGIHSDFGKSSTLESRTERDQEGNLRYRLIIHECQSGRNPMLSKAVKRGVLQNWKALKMVPFPFGESLADFFKGNRLGGWHFGGTLPMVDRPSSQSECDSSGMVSGLKEVYIVDSAAFPSLPASTVALLIAAHGHRVMRDWLARQAQTQGNTKHAN